jgi:glycerol uptake facilitator protein
MTPFISEIVGTFVLIALGVSVNANASFKSAYGYGGGWLLINFGWGLAVFCGVVVAGPFSGAHLNPAVTIGLAVAGLFPWADVAPFICAQFIGAMLGAFVVWLNFKDHFDREESPATKLGVFSTAPSIKHLPLNFIGEVTGTFMLVFIILYISGPEFLTVSVPDAKIGLGSLGALPVALLVMVIGMGFGGTTGYAINPARDLGPRMIHALMPIKGKGENDWGYAWLPVIAPMVGGVTAALLFLVLS